MAVAAIILGAGVIILLLERFVLLRDIKSLTKKIKEISSEGSNCQLTVQTRNIRVAELAAAVNLLQQMHKEDTLEYIRQSQEFKQSMADISHDLRTPLTALIGYLKMLRKGGQSADKQQEYLDIAYDKADVLHHLVSALFELARLESGTYHFEWKQVELCSVLTQELAAFYPQFAEQGREPQIDMAEESMCIWADEAAVQRVIGNLVQNALIHGTGTVRVKGYQNEEKVFLEISNEAPALTKEDVGVMFRRGYTADRTRQQKGGGLGLAIVKAFAEQMKGTVSAKLEDGMLNIKLEFLKEERRR